MGRKARLISKPHHCRQHPGYETQGHLQEFLFKGTEVLLCVSSFQGVQSPFTCPLPPTVVFLSLCLKTFPLTGRLLFLNCNRPSVLWRVPSGCKRCLGWVWKPCFGAGVGAGGVEGLLTSFLFLAASFFPAASYLWNVWSSLLCAAQETILYLAWGEVVAHFLGWGLKPWPGRVYHISTELRISLWLRHRSSKVKKQSWQVLPRLNWNCFIQCLNN